MIKLLLLQRLYNLSDKRVIEEAIEVEDNPKTKKIIEKANQFMKDPKFLESKGARSIVDQDARVGHKTKTKDFFGYKTEYMTTNDLIITAVHVCNGAYVDGKMFKKLLDLTNKGTLSVVSACPPVPVSGALKE